MTKLIICQENMAVIGRIAKALKKMTTTMVLYMAPNGSDIG